MRKAVVVGLVAGVVLVGGVVAVVSSDYLRAVVSDAVEPLPSSTASVGALDPAAGRYLDAVAAGDADAVAAVFAPDAVVVDVGREIRGRDAIRAWAQAEVIGGRYTLIDHTPRDGGTTMLVRFEPGGMAGFRASYRFDISDGLITTAILEYA
ncbi:nuclear transport factor 2 family protein [Actinophytocola sp. KF-1]